MISVPIEYIMEYIDIHGDVACLDANPGDNGIKPKPNIRNVRLFRTKYLVVRCGCVLIQ